MDARIEAWENGYKYCDVRNRSEKVKRIFHHFDVNRDGVLRQDELAALAIAVNPQVNFSNEEINVYVDDTLFLYGEIVDGKEGLTYAGLLFSYYDGFGDANRDFDTLAYDLKLIDLDSNEDDISKDAEIEQTAKREQATENHAKCSMKCPGEKMEGLLDSGNMYSHIKLKSPSNQLISALASNVDCNDVPEMVMELKEFGHAFKEDSVGIIDEINEETFVVCLLVRNLKSDLNLSFELLWDPGGYGQKLKDFGFGKLTLVTCPRRDGVPGALCLLHEEGETEMVLQMGENLLKERLPKSFKQDIVLAMALAYVDLSRDYMALSPPDYIKGCEVLERALKLLQEEGASSLAPDLQSQINETLGEINPCYALELLALPLSEEYRTRRGEGLQGMRNNLWAVGIKKNKRSLHIVDNDYMPEVVSVPLSRAKKSKFAQDISRPPYITAAQYSSRSSLLSSLVVAWSPVLQIKSEFGLNPPYNVSHCCSILAVASKSGKISFWRIHGPQCYSILPYGGPTAALLIGLLHAYKAWITALSWGLFASDSLNPQLILATGSSDGSVKIWRGYSDELLKSSEENFSIFSLLKEVIDVDSVPVSSLSLLIPIKSQNKIFLAVGKDSGALAVWIYDISINKFDKIVQEGAHNHIVTSLAWACGGRYLYSCSQDDSLRSWIVQENTLRYDPIPFNCLGVKSSTDVPNVFDSCVGFVVSPANMVLAVARNFDTDLLKPMYQARSQKAAVEFFWIGGQKLENISHRSASIDVEAFPDKELIHWDIISYGP